MTKTVYAQYNRTKAAAARLKEKQRLQGLVDKDVKKRKFLEYKAGLKDRNEQRELDAHRKAPMPKAAGQARSVSHQIEEAEAEARRKGKEEVSSSDDEVTVNRRPGDPPRKPEQFDPLVDYSSSDEEVTVKKRAPAKKARKAPGPRKPKNLPREKPSCEVGVRGGVFVPRVTKTTQKPYKRYLKYYEQCGNGQQDGFIQQVQERMAAFQASKKKRGLVKHKRKNAKTASNLLDKGFGVAKFA